MRTISGIILGYMVFAIPSYLLFRVTHHNPHVPASIGFEVSAIAYGIFFAFLGGYWGAMIAGRREMRVPIIIAVILAAFAIFSMVAAGVSWSPLFAVVLMAPSVLVGGYTQLKRRRR
jgi:CHASE2 domain-containing sensor protein